MARHPSPLAPLLVVLLAATAACSSSSRDEAAPPLGTTTAAATTAPSLPTATAPTGTATATATATASAHLSDARVEGRVVVDRLSSRPARDLVAFRRSQRAGQGSATHVPDCSSLDGSNTTI
jgi:hypothetical protein